jgi:hypothetical protein
MTNAELAALITATGAAIGAILMAIAALINARNNAAKVDILQDRIKSLEKDNEFLRRENEEKSLHNEHQDQVILAQQIKINKWQEWGQVVGRALNQYQLVVGAYEQQRQHQDVKQTGPLPKLSNEDE